MIRHIICLISLACLLAPAPAVAENAEQAYQKAREAYYALQNSSRKQMYREQWQRVYDRFASVHRRFPDSRRGADALYMCGKTISGLYGISRIKPDAERAVELFEEMADTYPDSSLSDDALLQAGKLLEDALHDKARAYLVYQRLVSALPRGDMSSKASARLKVLADYAPRPEPAPPAPAAARSEAAPAAAAAVALAPGAERQLTSIRYWSNPGYTRIVIDMSGETRFSANYLAAEPQQDQPPRIYVDLEQTSLVETLQESTVVDDGLLRRIRTGSPQDGVARVVLDLQSIGDYKVFPLVDPWRIVIDIAGDKAPELKSRETSISAMPETGEDAIAKVLKETPKEPPPLQIKDAAPTNELRRIVIDAGHGGKDPGAIGPSGILEKHVTLKLAQALAAELTRQIGCEVILTRNSDVYLPLEERTAIANKVGADLFISLHANANKSRKAYGIETYYLNFSKNDKAAAVAARENGTSLQQVSDLELILFDLMANAKINESSRLAAEIQKSLVHRVGKKFSNIRDLGVRQGPFYVLLGATMPSVLVEVAFISHPREEKRLASKDYQKYAAQAIAAAIKEYAVSNKLLVARR